MYSSKRWMESFEHRMAMCELCFIPESSNTCCVKVLPLEKEVNICIHMVVNIYLCISMYIYMHIIAFVLYRSLRILAMLNFCHYCFIPESSNTRYVKLLPLEKEVHINIYMSTNIYVYVYIHIYMSVSTYIYVYMYTYTCIYMHVYIFA
jgi:hypothetical protein